MTKYIFSIASLMLALGIAPAQGQTAVQTIIGTTITNNMQSATITVESSTCGSSGACTLNQNSAVKGQSASGNVKPSGAASVSWVQDWVAYVGSTHYACYFTVSVDSQFTAGQCHSVTTSASQKAGPGGTSHPACQPGTVIQPTVANGCSDGMVYFSITQ